MPYDIILYAVFAGETFIRAYRTKTAARQQASRWRKLDPSCTYRIFEFVPALSLKGVDLA
jgi:hypothetical protein